ncbi:MAG: formylmethanofuran dehydrogenase subunit B [Methanotrichaceae archaeon]
MPTCTGCSLLCEDIELSLKTGTISQAKNLCRKGHGHFQALFTERTSPSVDGQKVSIDEAIKKAAELLRNSEAPLLYGWSNSTLEAQSAGIELAKKLGAVIDDTSSFCRSLLLEMVLRGEIPTCTLDDVRNFADTSVFWGADPSNSHPRHLSRFAYYPRGEKRQKSYEEERTCIVIDVRKSSTATLCENYFKVPPGGDASFIESIISVLDSKIPKIGDKKKMIELGTILRKTEFGVIFPGLGMIYSLKENIGLLKSLVAKLNEITTFKVIPMVEHYNMRGFNELLLAQTGYINQVSFEGGTVKHGPEYSIVAVAAAKTCDTAMVIGSDPLSVLPFGTARSLAKIQLIAIDSRRSLTTDAAKVVIPSAMYGLEAGGSAIRMDGMKIKFDPFLKSDLPSDEEILNRIKEEI